MLRPLLAGVHGFVAFFGERVSALELLFHDKFFFRELFQSRLEFLQVWPVKAQHLTRRHQELAEGAKYALFWFG